MKNLLVCLQSLLVVLIMSSCDGPKKTSDNEPVTVSSIPQVDSGKPSTDTSLSVDQKDSTHENHPELREENVTGAQIIEIAIVKLTKQLTLGEEQKKGIKDALTSTFQSMGHDLNKSFRRDQSRILGKELIKQSSGQILSLLNDVQKTKFNTFLSH